MNAALLFLSSFLLVFCLVLQNLNVVHHRVALAAGTSLAIGVLQVISYKLIAMPTSPFEILAFIAGGPVGVIVSMQLERLRNRAVDRAQPLVVAQERAS